MYFLSYISYSVSPNISILAQKTEIEIYKIIISIN